MSIVDLFAEKDFFSREKLKLRVPAAPYYQNYTGLRYKVK